MKTNVNLAHLEGSFTKKIVTISVQAQHLSLVQNVSIVTRPVTHVIGIFQPIVYPVQEV